MSTKKSKATTTKKPARSPRPARPEPLQAAPEPAPAPAPATTPAAAAAPKPALMRTRLRTPAQKVTAELIRFLKIHAKRPYGRRGQKAILDLAQRATQQAQQESKTLTEVIPLHQRTFVETALARLQQEPPVEVSTGAGN